MIEPQPTRLADVEYRLNILKAEAHRALEAELPQHIARIRNEVKMYGIKPGAIFGRMRTRTRKPRPVKFRGPNGEEWSGFGTPPRWVRDSDQPISHWRIAP